MQIGESAQATIAAHRKWNDTGISLNAGEEYHFRADGTWKDWYVACDANGYESASILQRLFERLRRAPLERWFTLIGSIGRNNHEFFHLGLETTYIPRSTGTLNCFANDVGFMYWNNSGELQLTVMRSQ